MRRKTYKGGVALMRRNMGSRNIGLNVAEVAQLKVNEMAPISLNTSKGMVPVQPSHVKNYSVTYAPSLINSARKSATFNVSTLNPRRNIRSIGKKSRRTRRNRH